MPPFRKSFNPLANAINQLSDRIDNTSQARHGLGSQAGYGDLTAVPEENIFYARIIANQSALNNEGWNIHAFQQVFEADTEWEDDLSGIKTTLETMPLYEINNRLIPLDTVVRVWKGSGNWYLTDAGTTGCGVSAVYCAGNQLLVMYETPVPAPVGEFFCTRVIESYECEFFPVNKIYCSEWTRTTKINDTRTVTCPGDPIGILVEMAISTGRETIQECAVDCTTTTTTTQAP